MDMNSTITKGDVISAVCFVVGVVLLYKSVKGFVKDHQEKKADKKWKEEQRKKYGRFEAE